MPGIYDNFEALASNEQEHVDYKIDMQRISSNFAIVAPHGGRIERGTSQITRAIAGDEYAWYCFEGLKPESYKLHISSSKFDEPQALSVVANVDVVITIHGAYGKTPYAYFGGLHQELKNIMIEKLRLNGFDADHDPSPTRQGKRKTNICNLGKLKKGVQIELTGGFRKSLFDEPDQKDNRWKPNKDFWRFTNTLREVLTEY